ncbi:alkaline phosphatase family protein, partial [bacterium]|nr:alkaline phosphatase family protein [bacterium]
MIANLTMRHFFTRGLVQIVEYGSTRMIFAILIVCLLGYSTPSSATSPNNSINDIYVVLFVLDGGNYKYFDSLIKKGKLPNLKKYFYDEGAYFEKAITSFPTCSAPNYQGMITGLYPGESGVNYLGWFDRKNEKKYDYLTIKHVLRPNLDLFNTHAIINGNGNENHPITLFEVLDGYPTASIYSPITKGASRRSPKVPIGAIFNSLTGNELKLDKSALKYLYRSFVKDPDDIPRFTLIGLYGTDSSGHHYGTTSEEVELIYKHFDSFIDKFVTLLKKKDIYDKTYLVMVSDHGIHDISNTTRLDRDLWNEGFHVKYGNPRKSKGYNLLVMERGIASAQIYVRGNNGWRDIPDINYLTNLPTKSEKKNLIYFLRNHPAIDITAVFEDSNTTKVFSQNAEATIKYRLNN